MDWEGVCTQCGLVVGTPLVAIAPPARAAAVLKINSTVIPAELGRGRWLMLAEFHRNTLHGRERALASLLAEIKRIASCVGLPRHVVSEAEALARRYVTAVSGGREAVAAALLWLAARRAKAPRPLREFVKCSGAGGAVGRAALRLVELAGARPRAEDCVKAVAARAGLPASAAIKALEVLRRNKRMINGRNPWICATAALYLATDGQIPATRLAEAAGVAKSSVAKLATKMKTYPPFSTSCCLPPQLHIRPRKRMRSACGRCAGLLHAAAAVWRRRSIPTSEMNTATPSSAGPQLGRGLCW